MAILNRHKEMLKLLDLIKKVIDNKKIKKLRS